MAASAPPVAVGAGDEGRHAAGDDPLWSESFYLNFADHAGRLGGFVRLALHPARRESEGLLCVYLPEGGIGITLVKDALPHPDARVIRSGALALECLEPLARWRLAFDGTLNVFDDPARVPDALARNTSPAVTRAAQIELEQHGLHAPFFYPSYRRVASPPPHVARAAGGLARSLRRALRRPREVLSALSMRKTARHYEQSMRVRGTITLAGRTLAFDGTGHRDHSWGPRDWGLSERWRWLSGQLDGLAFNAMYLTIAGTHVTNGYVWSGGRSAPLDDLRLETTFDETGLAGRTVSLELAAGGVRHAIVGDVLMNVPLPIVGDRFRTMYNVGRTRYRSGDNVGYGVAEFLERLDP